MKKFVFIGVLFAASVAHALTPTPAKFNMVLPLPLTNPPSQTYTQQLVTRLMNYSFCATCGGGGGGGGDTPTVTITPTITNTPGPTVTPTEVVVLIEKYVTSFPDVPPEFLSGYTGQCALMSTNIVTGNPQLLQSCPGPIIQTIQMQTDPCLCPGSGSDSVQISTSTASANGCIAQGTGASCTATRCIALGADSACSVSSCIAAGEAAVCNEVGGVAIGKDAFANGNSAMTIGGQANEDAQSFGPNSKALGLNSIAIGNSALVEDDAPSAVCIGAGSFCAESLGLGFGADASPGGGTCFGKTCFSQMGDFTFGGEDQKVHPVWNAETMTVGSGCGSGAALEAYSNDVAGAVTVGTGTVTSCQLDFGDPWANKPSCFANDETNIVILQVVPSTSALIINAALPLDGDTIRYGCPVSYSGATPTATETATPTP